MKKFFTIILLLLIVIAVVAAGGAYWTITQKNTVPQNYRLTINQGDNWQTIAKQLKQDNIINNEKAFVLFSRYHNGKLKTGGFPISGDLSIMDIVRHLSTAAPEKISVRINEGFTIQQIRDKIYLSGSLKNNVQALQDKEILQLLDPNSEYKSLEGLLFPDTYLFNGTPKETDVYQIAYKTMQKHLNNAWQNRDENLPYKSPYELLIMASIIEKETGHKDDRALVSAVFANRLKKNMRLQTDPTVIYGMGDKYQGKIHKADLQTDTPYNTYTRAGLPPTPIAAPSLASIDAAAHPAQVDYLYFVAKSDGSGKSQFSRTLNEHNQAVREHILKK